jgi:ribosomal protein S18 acetylase RimI-like enzyme
VEIENSSFLADHFTLTQFKYLLVKAKADFLVYVNSQNHVVGYVVALVRKNCRHLRIYSIAIHNNYRGTGIARALFTELENIAAKRIVDLTLEVRIDRDDLVSIYEKLGYKKYGIKKDYYSDGTAAIKMKKIIK